MNNDPITPRTVFPVGFGPRSDSCYHCWKGIQHEHHEDIPTCERVSDVLRAFPGCQPYSIKHDGVCPLVYANSYDLRDGVHFAVKSMADIPSAARFIFERLDQMNRE